MKVGNHIATKAEKCVVAMSGGVDSSVAALLLKQMGYDLIGVSLQVWDYSRHCSSTMKTCCSPKDFQDARLVAHKVGIPFYVFDLEEEFESKVVKKFISNYQRGFTPSPCIDCNVFVKFGALIDKADQLGYPNVATGHYARVIRVEDRNFIARGLDQSKDQSYFLYGLKPELLDRVIFPLGTYRKEEVRVIARENGLVTHSKKDSQDLCFISGSVGDFLKQNLNGNTSGVIKHVNGKTLGFTDNIYKFTVGQRKGLRVSYPTPLYVIGILPDEKTVVVGEKSFLDVPSFIVTDWVWHAKPGSFSGLIQVRSRHKSIRCSVQELDSTSVRVNLHGEFSIITPGQAAVLYDESNTYILGGGVINRWIQ